MPTARAADRTRKPRPLEPRGRSLPLPDQLAQGILAAVPALEDHPRRAPFEEPLGREQTRGGVLLEHGERALIRRDLELASAAGADGFVVGALDAEGRLDLEALASWRAAAPGAPFTVHRAFDEDPEPDQALTALGDLGFARVLTTGGGDDVGSGLTGLQRLAARGAEDPELPRVLPGGGVRAANARAVLEATGGTELHTSARTAASGRLDAGPRFGALVLPDETEIAALVEATRAAVER